MPLAAALPVVNPHECGAQDAKRSRPVVTPLCVFAAHRDEFDAVVRATCRESALSALFDQLPLEECGWEILTTRLTVIAGAREGDDLWPIFRVSRI